MPFTPTNKHNLPIAIYEAWKNRPYSKGDSKWSVSQLINPPRMVQLETRLGKELEMDVHDSLYALDGSAFHALFEWAKPAIEAQYPGRYLFEQRYFAEVEGAKISGQLDVIDTQLCELGDYKKTSKSVAKYGAKVEWERQLNCYRWLAHVNGIRIDHLTIHALYRDWVKTQTLRDPSYPKLQYERWEIPVWDMKVAENYVKDRVKLHKAAESLTKSKLPACTAEEKWQSTSYRIILDGDSRARRVVESRQEASKWIADNIQGSKDLARVNVEKVDGDPIRCKLYCPVRFHCSLAKGVAVE